MAENAERDQNSIPTLLGVSNVDGQSPVRIYADPVTHRLLVTSITGTLSGVQSVSVVTSNGVSGTVTNPTTTPAITLSLGNITPANVSTTELDATRISINSQASIDSSGNANVFSLNVNNMVAITSAGVFQIQVGSFNIANLFNIDNNGRVTMTAPTTAYASFNLPTGSAPTSPVDGDVWRQDNTNTGLKIRVNGVTKTITLS